MTQVNGIAIWAEGIKAELARRLPRQRKTQRDKLAVLVATMLHVRSANLVEVPAKTILDAGARYRMTLGRTPALVRLQVTNLTNAFDWQIVGSGGYQVNAPRSLTLFLTMDL